MSSNMMMTPQEKGDWLKTLEPNDKVLIKSGWTAMWNERIGTVERFTPTQLLVKHTSNPHAPYLRFRLKDGRCIGEDSAIIEPLTNEKVAQLKKRKIKRKLDMYAGWDSMTLDQLEQLWSLVCAYEKEAGHDR